MLASRSEDPLERKMLEIVETACPAAPEAQWYEVWYLLQRRRHNTNCGLEALRGCGGGAACAPTRHRLKLRMPTALGVSFFWCNF